MNIEWGKRVFDHTRGQFFTVKSKNVSCAFQFDGIPTKTILYLFSVTRSTIL